MLIQLIAGSYRFKLSDNSLHFTFRVIKGQANRRRPGGEIPQVSPQYQGLLLSNYSFEDLRPGLISQRQVANSRIKETAQGLKSSLGALLMSQGVPSMTIPVQLPSESSCEGGNQTKKVSSHQNRTDAASCFQLLTSAEKNFKNA